ncbi:uncharacterized protein LOC127103500 [Lathyrus oleraceus]|uniref:uncharacterized protein LOC127103500 n=1 Tax=Pisum sativum TaxID=3888 RepID=UPI0021CF9F0B|nr:uncharacterized protein LOC127103500 [Pisum sativum]
MSKGSDMRNPTKHTSGTENQIEAERSAIDKELQKFVTSLLKEVNSDVFPEFKHIWQKKLDLMVILVKKTEESVPEHAAYERRSKKKADECVPEQAAHERRSKKKVDHVLNVDDLTYDEEPLTNIMTPSIAKKLQRRKGKVMVFEDSPSKEIKRKSGGMKSTPSRSSVGKSLVGPTRSWSKVVTPTRKRKVVSSKNAERWKYVMQRRVALERELGKDALKCKEIVELIEAVGLMKTITKFGPCCESLVKEFVVIIPNRCDGVKSADYKKLEVTHDQVCKEITIKQVKQWPNGGKLSTGKLSVKYAILHKIGTTNWVPSNHTSTISNGLGKFSYAIGTRRAFDFGKYIFEQVMKQTLSTAVKMPICFPSLIYGIILNQHPGILLPIDSVKKKESPLSLHYKLFAGTHVPYIVMTSSQAFIEEKEAEHGGDDNGGADVEDSIGGNDVETNEDKEAKGEEYVDANSDSQEDI